MAKLLLVDDSPSMLTKLTALLSDDHEIITGEDGIDAVWLFKTAQPDAVLLDINMPVMNGIEALKKIRMVNPDARVAILSAERDTSSIMVAIADGAVDFIAKPYTRERIKSAIDGLLAA